MGIVVKKKEHVVHSNSKRQKWHNLFACKVIYGNDKIKITCVVAALNSIPNHVASPRPDILAKVIMRTPARASPIDESMLNKQHPSVRSWE
jgi:hypothetical protein